MFTPLTGTTDRTKYAANEFGFALPIAIACVALAVVIAFPTRTEAANRAGAREA